MASALTHRVVVPQPGDDCASLVRTAMSRALRRCVIARGDPELDADDRDDSSRPFPPPPKNRPASRPGCATDADAEFAHLCHPRAARWVCFPFGERAYTVQAKSACAPPLAASFMDERRWRRLASSRLARASATGWRAAAAAGAAVVRRLPFDVDNEQLSPDVPFALAPGLCLVECLCAARSASVFRARIMLRPALAAVDGADARPSIEVECVAKIINVRLSGDFSRGWAGTRRSTPRGGHLVCAPAWSEPIALSRAYPSHFYGSGLFFCATDGDWYVCLVMPLYKSTLWALLGGLTPDCAVGDRATPWADMLLAALAQVVLHTLARARRAHLASHNDLKIDNVAYRRTTRRHVYVRLIDLPGAPLLAIPTHGRLYYVIDFGWSSTTVPDGAHRSVHIESAACEVAGGAAMRAWNPGTDPAQVAYSLISAARRRLGCDVHASIYSQTARSWWPLFDALAGLMAVGPRSATPHSGPPVVLPIDQGNRVTRNLPKRSDQHVAGEPDGGCLPLGEHRDSDSAAHNDGAHKNNHDGDDKDDDSAWDDLFYAEISRSCHLARFDDFLTIMIDRFSISDSSESRTDRPSARRLVMTYVVDDLIARRGPVVTRPLLCRR